MIQLKSSFLVSLIGVNVRLAQDFPSGPKVEADRDGLCHAKFGETLFNQMIESVLWLKHGQSEAGVAVEQKGRTLTAFLPSCFTRAATSADGTCGGATDVPNRLTPGKAHVSSS